MKQIEIAPSRNSDKTNETSLREPMKILKIESTVGRSLSQKLQLRKLTFADDHGGRLFQNIYVERLHYSSKIEETEGQAACCIIS